MKSIILALMFLVAGLASGQTFKLQYLAKSSSAGTFVLRDTLKAGTHSRGADTSNWRPQDTTWGVGVRTVYDSIVVDTLSGNYNTVYVTTSADIGNGLSGDSVVYEVWDAIFRQWIPLNLIDLSLNSSPIVNVTYVASNATRKTFQINHKGIIYLRRRLVNSGGNWDASRYSLQTLLLLNTY